VKLNLFNRIAVAEIGNPNTMGLMISGLRMVFTIKKTITSEANTCNLDVYNLNEESRNKIQQLDTVCILKAGYNDKPVEIFKGYLSEVNHIFEPPNIITKLGIDDGSKVLKQSKVSVSYEGGSSLKQAINDVLKGFQLPEKIKNSLIEVVDKKFINGFSYVGKSKDLMDKLAKVAGIEWSIQNNEIKILKQDKSDKILATKLAYSTGLIQSPERIKEVGKDDSTTTQNPGTFGWKIKSLLQPQIEPGNAIIVESKMIPKDSKFKVITVEHSGDTHGNDWITQLQVIDL
jgi:hypothetical protein